jgi:hypothetical protein
VGVLTQLLGSWLCPVTYLSKQLDAVSWGWLPCLCALAATAILMTEEDKLTLGQKLTVRVPYSFDSHEIQRKLLVSKLPNSQISKHVLWKPTCPATGC